MQIKRFEAKNMTTALRLIKSELGPDAVILSARSLRKGKGFFGSMKYAGVEVTAAIDTRGAKPQTGNPAGENTAYANLLNSQKPYVDQGPEPAERSSMDSQAGIRVRQRRPDRHNRVNSGNHRVLSSLYQHILNQGVDRGIASEIIDEIKRIPDSREVMANDELNDHFHSILEDLGVWVDKNVFVRAKPNIVALIGTTGAGKTTTIAKLAAMQSNRHRKQVAMISIDNYGIAANQQLAAYARIIGIPLELAVGGNELKRAIKKFKDKDLILIDTPGINPKDPNQIRELELIFDKLPELQKHFVISAATKESDLAELSETFDQLGIQRLVFTKIDESCTYGNMLNLLIRTSLPLSFISCGRKVPEDIEPGSIQKIVDLIFRINKLNRKPSSESPKPNVQESRDTTAKISDPPNFVANKNSDVYHYTDCKWSDKIKPDNIVQFNSTQEAEAKNFLPCRSCNPDRPRSEVPRGSRTATRKFSSYL
jgi:flagellar biosynthesis protein FlhF